jgi:YHS domain-containing protein
LQNQSVNAGISRFASWFFRVQAIANRVPALQTSDRDYEEVSWMPMDPVCGVKVETDETLATTFEGQTYYFCSEDCKQDFVEAPEDFISQNAEMMMDDFE